MQTVNKNRVHEDNRGSFNNVTCHTASVITASEATKRSRQVHPGVTTAKVHIYQCLPLCLFMISAAALLTERALIILMLWCFSTDQSYNTVVQGDSSVFV